MGISKRLRKVRGQRKPVYDAEVYVRGIRVAFKTCETRGQAEEWYAVSKAQFFSGEPQPPQEVEVLPTFREVFERYKVERLPLLRMSSQQTHAVRFRYLIDSPLAPVLMKDFTDKTVDVWLAWLRRHPTCSDPKRKSFRQELVILSAVLHWYRDYLDAKFAIPIVKRHRQQTRFRSVAPRRPDYYIRPDDIQNWVRWLHDHSQLQTYWQLALFLTHTGARIGEAAGLLWDAVDFEMGTVSIIRTVWWDHHTKEPQLQECTKNDESVRAIYLAPPVAEMLKRMRQISKPNDPVFPSAKGGLLRYPAIQNAFNRAFMALSLPWRSTHICRHSFGTLALKATRDLSAVQAALGHSDIKQTQGYAKIVALMDGVASSKTAQMIAIGPISARDSPGPARGVSKNHG